MLFASTKPIILVVLLLVANVAAFSVIPQRAVVTSRGSACLFMSEGEPDKSSDAAPPSAANFIPGAQKPVEVETAYPIPLPSPILLGTSMVLGIASIGEFCVDLN